MSEVLLSQTPHVTGDTFVAEREEAIRSYVSHTGGYPVAREAYKFMQNEIDETVNESLGRVDVHSLTEDELQKLHVEVVDVIRLFRHDEAPGITPVEWHRNLDVRLANARNFLETSAENLTTEHDLREYEELCLVIDAAYDIADTLQRLEVVMEVADAVSEFVFLHRVM